MNPQPTVPDRTNPRESGVRPNVVGPYPFLSLPDHPGELGRLGPYRVLSLLGEGGMEFVFRAEHDILRRLVAIKVMKPEEARNPIARERFLREGRAAAAVRCDHVVTIHSVGDENEVPFLDMELLEGHNLEDWLKARPEPVTANEIVWVARDTLRGLVEAHNQGLIHRDVKPANLWVESKVRRIKLLDFGITRRPGIDPTLTLAGKVLGTPAYMAPEQARARAVDVRTDLFSLGAVLFRMLTGHSPFQQESYDATLLSLFLDEPPSASSFGALPAALAKLIDQLLAKERDRRPQTATEALEVVLAVERALLAPTTVPPVPARIPSIPVARPSVPPVAVVVPTTAPLAEMEEEFEYVIEGEKRKGTRRVLVMDIGGGQMMKFVWIEKGTFLMGAPKGDVGAHSEEKPQRQVTVSRDFYLGMYAVTQAEYKAVTGQSPSQFKGDRLPVEKVSWEDAVAFCQQLSGLVYRQIELPTEAQWEYACRAGTTTPFHFGSKLNGDLANCNGNLPYGTETTGLNKGRTMAVGSYPANPWGLYDMHGNVWEWCQDDHGPYTPGEQTDPIQLSNDSRLSRRVNRGCSWKQPCGDCRAALRNAFPPGQRWGDFGFRVCFRLD